jgi:hypothetical protein
MSTRSRIFSLLGAVVAVTTVACADSPTGPTANGRPAVRNIEGDTLECRSGWTISEGRYVCLGDTQIM